MKRNLLIGLFLILNQTLSAQSQFHLRYGTTFHEETKRVIQTNDGNYIVAGQTDGFGSGGNAFLMKVNGNGNIIWIKDYSGINSDIIFDVIELADSNLVMCGATMSFGAG